MRPLALLFVAPLALHLACSSSNFAPLADSSAADADAAAHDATDEEADAGRVDAGRAKSRDGGRVDAGQGGADAGATDSAVIPVDPLCETVTGTVTFGASIPRASAVPMPFGYSVSINGTHPSGNTVGNGREQWFSITVDAPRDIALTLNGSRTSVSFFFESDTTSSFGLGGFIMTKTASFKAGTYYVKVSDGIAATQGGAWDVSMRWVVPPAVCADAGLRLVSSSTRADLRGARRRARRRSGENARCGP